MKFPFFLNKKKPLSGSHPPPKRHHQTNNAVILENNNCSYYEVPSSFPVYFPATTKLSPISSTFYPFTNSHVSLLLTRFVI